MVNVKNKPKPSGYITIYSNVVLMSSIFIPPYIFCKIIVTGICFFVNKTHLSKTPNSDFILFTEICNADLISLYFFTLTKSICIEIIKDMKG